MYAIFESSADNKEFTLNLWISTTPVGRESEMLIIVWQYSVGFMHENYEQTMNK